MIDGSLWNVIWLGEFTRYVIVFSRKYGKEKSLFETQTANVFKNKKLNYNKLFQPQNNLKYALTNVDYMFS